MDIQIMRQAGVMGFILYFLRHTQSSIVYAYAEERMRAAEDFLCTQDRHDENGRPYMQCSITCRPICAFPLCES